MSFVCVSAASFDFSSNCDGLFLICRVVLFDGAVFFCLRSVRLFCEFVGFWVGACCLAVYAWLTSRADVPACALDISCCTC